MLRGFKNIRELLGKSQNYRTCRGSPLAGIKCLFHLRNLVEGTGKGEHDKHSDKSQGPNPNTINTSKSGSAARRNLQYSSRFLAIKHPDVGMDSQQRF
jgi:hypothetical protein